METKLLNLAVYASIAPKNQPHPRLLKTIVTQAESALRLFLLGLLGSLGDLSRTTLGLLDGLDNSDGDGLAHVADSETTKRRVVGEGLDTHGLGRNHLDDGSVTGLEELGVLLDRLAGTAVDLLEQLGELASNVGSVAVKHRSVTSADLARVVEDDDLSVERVNAAWWVVLGVTADVATANVLDGHVLHVETNVVTRLTLLELLVVHLNGLDFSGDVGRSEGNNHTRSNDTSLDTADRHSADTRDLVDILERKTEGLVVRADWRLDGVDGLEQGLTGDGAALGLLGPALVPWALVGGLKHVVTVETRDGDEGNGLGVVADLLDEVGGFLNDFVVAVLRPLAGVHLVESNDELPDTEGESKQGVLTSLAILGDTSLELTSTGGNDEDSAVGLGGTSDHVLDEVTVTRSVCRRR